MPLGVWWLELFVENLRGLFRAKILVRVLASSFLYSAGDNFIKGHFASLV